MKPLDYRLNSRLLIANVCGADKTVHLEGHLNYQGQKCGTHYFVIRDGGLKLIRRVLEN